MQDGAKERPVVGVVPVGLVFCARLAREILRTWEATEEERTALTQAIVQMHNAKPAEDHRQSAIVFAHLYSETNAGRWSLLWNERVLAALRSKGDVNALLIADKTEIAREIYDNTNLTGEEKAAIVRVIAREYLVMHNMLRRGAVQANAVPRLPGPLTCKRDPGSVEISFSACYRETLGEEWDTGDEALIRTIQVPVVRKIVCLDLMAVVRALANDQIIEVLHDTSMDWHAELRARYAKEIKMYRRYLELRA